MTVPLSNEIREQVAKDVALMRADPTFRPLWVFFDAKPHPDLAALLRSNRILFHELGKPKG